MSLLRNLSRRFLLKCPSPKCPNDFCYSFHPLPCPKLQTIPNGLSTRRPKHDKKVNGDNEIPRLI